MARKPTHKALEETIKELENLEAELKQAEEALRESEDKYRFLFDMVSDALALIEIKTGNMLDVNKAFIEFYGYSKEEVLRMKNTDFSAEPEETKQATRDRGTYVPVRYHKKKDGIVFPTEITASIFKYEGRDVHIAAIRDITERKRLEAQLQRSQKMESIGLLAGGVAHDLNNVLSGIVSYPELLLILLDMIMDPGINGLETYKRIIKIHPKQKAVILSGFAETDAVKDAQKLGAGRYTKKPFTLEKIGTVIRDELKK